MSTDDGGPARALTPSELPQTPGSGEARLSVSGVRKHLRVLLSADSVSDDDARNAEAGLQRIATECGIYRTATEIRSLITGTASLELKDDNWSLGRGSELAGEFFFLHLQQEIDSLAENDKSLGPSVFKSYCDELFDCFFRSDHVRKGVGFPIMLMERLVTKAAGSMGRGQLYLVLAEQGLRSAIELSSQKYERDLQKERRATRLYKRGETPAPKKRSPKRVLGEDTLNHLENVHAQFEVLKESFSRVVASQHEGTREGRLAFLRELLTGAEKAGNLGVTGLLKETLGMMLATAQPNQAAALLFAAACDLETLADEENELLFSNMSSRRYRRAHKLYRVTKSMEEATRVKEKILKMKSLYDKDLLAIAQL